MTVSPPASIVELVGASDTWQPLGHESWLTDGHVLYRCDSPADAAALTVAIAADQTTWSDVALAIDEWLVTVRPLGQGADRPERHGEIGGLAELAGQELRRIHSQPLDDRPARGWSSVASRVQSSQVDPATLAEPFCRYDRDRLIELWSEGRPSSESLVVCHGQPRLEHLLVDAGSVTGWLEPRHTVVADRHLDLAIAHRSIQTCLGNDAVFRFYEAYGQDPSLPSLEHYLLADLLLP